MVTGPSVGQLVVRLSVARFNFLGRFLSNSMRQIWLCTLCIHPNLFEEYRLVSLCLFILYHLKPKPTRTSGCCSYSLHRHVIIVIVIVIVMFVISRVQEVADGWSGLLH